MQRASRRISVLVFALGLVVPVVAHAYDTSYGPLYYSGSTLVRRSVPVYLYVPPGTTMINNLTVDDAENELKLGLNRWLEESAAKLIPYYAGRTTSTGDDGRVVVAERALSCLDPGDIACVEFNDDLVFTPLPALVHVGATVGLRPGQLFSPEGFQTSVVHELGHAWGLQDTYPSAPEQTGGIMGGPVNGYNLCMKGPGALGKDDILGMQKLYGERFFALYYRESIDAAVSWRDPDYNDQGSSLTSVSLGGSGSRASFLESYVLGRSGTPRFVQSSTQAASNAYNEFAIPDAVTTRAPVSVAQKSEKAWMIVYAGWDTQTDCRRSIIYAITEDGGFTYIWGELETRDHKILKTPFPQATAAYNAIQDRYVVAFIETLREGQDPKETADGWVRVVSVDAKRDQNGSYPQRWMSSVPGKNVDGFNDGKQRSWHTPAIACTSYDPLYPCLIAWTDVDMPHGISWVRFAPGDVGDEDFVVLSARYKMFQPKHKTTIRSLTRPSLIAQSNASYPFVLAVKQDFNPNEQALVSYTKAASEADWNPPKFAAMYRDFTQFYAPTLNEIELLDLTQARTEGGKVGAAKSARELHMRYGIGSL